MVGGVLFVSTGLGQIAALDATTGRTRWVYDPESYTGAPPANVIGFQTRGVAYWSEGTNGRILFGTNDGYLVAIDARTGRADLRVRQQREGGSDDRHSGG